MAKENSKELKLKIELVPEKSWFKSLREYMERLRERLRRRWH